MAASSVRTLMLTERVPALVGLPPAAADYLLAEHRAAVRLTPTRRRHRYRLTPLGRVGVLPAPGVRLVIRPKIPLRNVFYLLDPAASLPAAEDDASTPEPAGAALDFLARQLSRLLTERADAGLHRGYVERADDGPFLHGRLDLPAQLRERRPHFLHCVHDDFTANVPCNQAPRATAEQLLRSPLVGDAARIALRQALRGYEGVTAIADVDVQYAPVEYRPLLDLCALLDDAQRPGAAVGDTAGPAFLLDLGRVFERYVAAGVAAVCGPAARVQPTVAVGGLVLRPDLLIERDGMPTVVADTKWKRPRPAPADLYQVIAYAATFGAQRAVLIYPGSHDRLRRSVVGSLRLELRTLNVAGPAEACRRALKRLARCLAHD